MIALILCACVVSGVAIGHTITRGLESLGILA
jgi:hypothetical protein